MYTIDNSISKQLLFELKCNKNPSLDKIKHILQKGADVNYIDFDGYTPLYCATHNGAPSEIIKELLDAGAEDR